jgi:small neutral amino acid transporter SnatA (MarC family)
VAEVAALITVVPLALPTTAAASSLLAALVPHSAQPHHSWETVYWGCTAAGAASLLVTLVCTTRFIIS